MKIVNFFRNVVAYLKTRLLYPLFFKAIGKRTLIQTPMQIDDSRSIWIGMYTNIAQGAWLMGNGSCGKVTLKIGNYNQIGHLCHIVAWEEVIIEDSVLIADKVYISDCTHSYQNIHEPIYKQNVRVIGRVKIGEGSWIGENVVIIGAKIGKHCVIGANSVVNKDIPDYCVAVGNPAKIVKRYDIDSNMWIRLEGSV